MAREDPHFRLRIPESLRQQVQQAADLQRRSMTAEIVARLERTFAMDAANEEIYRRLSRGEPPESPPPPESEDDYGVEIPHSTDPSIGTVEAEFHHEMDQLTLRMARRLAGLREAAILAPSKGSGEVRAETRVRKSKPSQPEEQAMAPKKKQPTTQEVHEAGQNAHRDGKSRNDNPFAWSTALSQHWLDGWDQVEKDING